MTLYVTSDLHLEHSNIIEYCDRPYEDVDQMNADLISNWNNRVEKEDVVIFLGDLVFGGKDEIVSYIDKLNGNILFIQGNHDDVDASFPFPVCQSTTIEHSGIEFFCSHYPENVPDGANWWHLYGHVHNNDLEEYPFISPGNKRINVSTDVTGYGPISMDSIIEYIQEGLRHETVPNKN